MAQNKTIALISSQYLFRDPRYLLFAKSYKKIGFNVICISLLATITADQKNTELYKNFKCISLIQDCPNTNSNNYNHSNSKNTSIINKNIFSSIKKYLFSKISLGLYNKIIKSILILKEELVRPLYIHYLHRKTKQAVNSNKFKQLMDNIDTIHGCEFLFGAIAACYAAKKYNKQLIIDAKEHHRYMVPEFSRFTFSFIKKHEKIVFEQANQIPCVSEPIIECYKELYPDFAHKFIYMPNCQELDSNSFDATHSNIEKLSTNTNKVKFIVLATYLPFVRGIEYLIQVWDKLSPKNAELYIYLSNLNSISKNYLLKQCPNTLNKSLFLMDPVKEDDINSTIAKYDVGIIPYLPNETINHLYCCPNKFGQYLKNGLAIMSSDTINIPNQIKKHNIGFIYPTDDLSAAIDIFKKSILDKDYLLNVRMNSFNYYKNIYNWDYYTNKLIKAQATEA